MQQGGAVTKSFFFNLASGAINETKVVETAPQKKYVYSL